jgi:predicted phage baseplate assembly protein
MNQPCGCCEGTEALTPMPTANRPGLHALLYRVGTHATFLETMKAQLSSARFPELAILKTRADDDPAIALLDAWAVVADVLTFYQERIINEGYLQTATERRSILELSRLIGYTLRPGVAATAYLAYTLDEDRSVTPPKPASSSISAGAHAQSVPAGPGELPQTFETSDDLEASSSWNNLQVRLTQPQKITCDNLPAGTGWDKIKTIYFEGTATNLKPNDPLVIVCAGGENEQHVRWVEKVKPQNVENRTEVTLQRLAAGTNTEDDPFKNAIAIVQPFLDDQDPASKMFPDNQIADEVVVTLNELKATLVNEAAPPSASSTSDDKHKIVIAMVVKVLPNLRKAYDLAVSRQFTRLAPWIGELLNGLQSLVDELSEVTSDAPSVALTPSAIADGPSSPALEQLGTVLVPLSKAPSEHPASAARLTRTAKQTFDPQADTAPQLLTTLRSDLAPVLYQAWESLASPSSELTVHALRVKAAPFGNNAPLKPILNANGTVKRSEEWPIQGTEVISLDLTVLSEAVISLKRGGEVFSIDSDLTKAAGGEVKGEVNGLNVSITGLPDSNQPGPVTLKITITLTANEETHSIVISVANIGDGSDSIKVTISRGEIQILKDQVVGRGGSVLKPVSDGTITISYVEGISEASDVISILMESLFPPDARNVLALDAQYDQITPESWVVIQRPNPDPKDPKNPTVKIHRTEAVQTISKADYGITGKVTQLTLKDDWLVSTDLLLSVLRATTVFAQSEKLTLAEEPIDAEIAGDRIELDGLYSGLQPGRWLIVSGERSDVPDVTGVQASELQMLASVEQKSNPDLPGETPHSTLILAKELAYRYVPRTVTVYGNVVKATHGETRKEVLGSGDGSKALQQFALRQPPLTFVAADNPSGVDSTLKVYVNDVLWHETDSLAGLQPTDRKFITRTDDAVKTTVIFGNGRQGARLPTGQENVKSVYRNGIGKPGNVKPDQISQLPTRPIGVKAVTNPLRASGGADKENRDQARQNAPLAVMALDRLVSTQDYADFARTFAGIGKASATRLSDGRRQLVHVTIAGADDIPIDKNSDLYRSLFAALQDFGDPYLPIQVDPRELLALVLSANIRVSPDHQWDSADRLKSVKTQVVAALVDQFGFQRRDLGQTVFLSEVIAAIQRVDGVAYVDVDMLDSISETELSSPDLVNKLTELAESSKPRPYVPVRLAETALPASNILVRPAVNGIFPAQLAFLPEALATLILNEVPR